MAQFDIGVTDIPRGGFSFELCKRWEYHIDV